VGVKSGVPAAKQVLIADRALPYEAAKYVNPCT
jgi:hypothetical protein